MISAPRPSFLNVVSHQKLDGGKIWLRRLDYNLFFFFFFSFGLSPSLTLQGENDIDQLCCVLRVLGTPNESIWPVSKEVTYELSEHTGTKECSYN